MKAILLIIALLFLSGCQPTTTTSPVSSSDTTDSDRDGITDGNDNCPTIANSTQIDSNGNGIGDSCEIISSSTTKTDDALIYLNQLRQRAGMIPFNKQDNLTASAANHANYLKLNQATGHAEFSGNNGYSGDYASDRAIATGYSSRTVSENISAHSEVTTAKESIDNLMSAIYHRFGFLDLETDEIGIGYISDTADIFVYNMGVSGLRTLCDGSSYIGTESYYPNICADSSFRIKASDYEQVLSNLQASNPDIITWPADGDNDVPPAFYEENPDPLPNHGVSGYPVSVQFNTSKIAQAPTNVSLKLYSASDNLIVSTITQSDPGKLFTKYQFVLFPYQRLEWNKQYRAELSYDLNGVLSKTWQFKTRDPGYTIQTLSTDGQNITATSGQTFILYSPPENEFDISSGYSTSTPSTMQLDIRRIDAHTLQITATGSGVATINFHNKQFTLSLL